MVNIFASTRTALATWFHLIQTNTRTGSSKVITTVCNKNSIEKIKSSLENISSEKNMYIYSIDPTPVYEPNRRCDICNC
jgi:hypothetical protein